jgi:hypothetical protein
MDAKLHDATINSNYTCVAVNNLKCSWNLKLCKQSTGNLK